MGEGFTARHCPVCTHSFVHYFLELPLPQCRGQRCARKSPRRRTTRLAATLPEPHGPRVAATCPPRWAVVRPGGSRCRLMRLLQCRRPWAMGFVMGSSGPIRKTVIESKGFRYGGAVRWQDSASGQRSGSTAVWAHVTALAINRDNTVRWSSTAPHPTKGKPPRNPADGILIRGRNDFSDRVPKQKHRYAHRHQFPSPTDLVPLPLWALVRLPLTALPTLLPLRCGLYDMQSAGGVLAPSVCTFFCDLLSVDSVFLWYLSLAFFFPLLRNILALKYSEL